MNKFLVLLLIFPLYFIAYAQDNCNCAAIDTIKTTETYQNFKSWLLNFTTPTTPSWNGHNASGWKNDFLNVNGFDERMQYGGEDREFGERLVNNGLKSKQIRYSTVCIHLDHARGYVKPEMIQKNLQIRKETKDHKKKWTEFGIKK